MKKNILTILLSLVCYSGFSTDYSNLSYLYKPTRIGLYGGAGLATSNNYDVGVSGGLDFHVWIQNRTYLGALIFLQQYNLHYDKEAMQATHGTGYAGMVLRHDSKYAFFSPKIQRSLWSRVNFIPWVYLTAGAGFKVSGYDSVTKWDHGTGPSYPGYYDSTLDASANINPMIFRVGFGFAQDIYLGKGNWWFSIREDFGFLYSGLTKTGDVTHQEPGRTIYSPQKLNPGYISLHLGITYIKSRKMK